MNILITGGSSGLGKEVIKKLATDSASRIYFTYRSKATAAKELCCRFSNATGINCDFSDSSDIDSLLANISEWDIDILINNAWAGSPNGTYFHKTPADNYLQAFIMNVIPVIKITQECITVFRKKKQGRIINVMTSSLLDLPPAGYSVYAATKAYIHQLSKSWCKENQRFNITCNCVMPDYMETDFANVDERVIEQMKAEHPLKKLLTTEEVSDVIVWLANTSSQVNGVSIPITAAQHVI